MAASPKSARGRGPFRRRCDGRSTIAIADVASRAAAFRSVRAITSATGPEAGRPRCRIFAVLCRRHHRAVHEEGYEVERQPDGELRFRRPDGRVMPMVPSPAAVQADSVEILRARHEALGLGLHARTAMPGWLGERLDVGWAIDVLHPLSLRSSLTYNCAAKPDARRRARGQVSSHA